MALAILWFLDGVSEEASAYLRVVPKCVAGFVYNEV